MTSCCSALEHKQAPARQRQQSAGQTPPLMAIKSWYETLNTTLTLSDYRQLNAHLIEHADTVTSDTILTCTSMTVPAGIYAMHFIRRKQNSRQTMRNKQSEGKRSTKKSQQ